MSIRKLWYAPARAQQSEQVKKRDDEILRRMLKNSVRSEKRNGATRRQPERGR